MLPQWHACHCYALCRAGTCPRRVQELPNAFRRAADSRPYEICHSQRRSTLLHLKLYFLKPELLISVAVHRRARRPRRAGAGTTDWAQTSHCVIANPVRTLGVAISCRNYPLPTNSFMPTACRFADGTPSRRALRSAYEAVLESFSFNSIVGADSIRPRAGTTDCVKICSPVPSAASRTAGGRLRAPPVAEKASKKEWQNQGD